MNLVRMYRAFGLNILSEVEVPSWPPGSPPGDVCIQWGNVPETLPHATELWGVFWGERGRCVLNYPDIGRVLIESGKSITCALAKGATAKQLANVLASTAIAALLYQRGHLCLHASAAVRNGKAFLVSGPSGAGKSTIVSALVQRGFEMLSDDITVVQARGDKTFEAVPSFPAVRLHRDSLRALALAEDSGPDIDPTDEKQRRPIVENFHETPVRIERICRLETGLGNWPLRLPVTGVGRIKRLQRCLFRPAMAKVLGDERVLSEVSIAMARSIEQRHIIRPASGFYIDELCAFVSEE